MEQSPAGESITDNELLRRITHRDDEALGILYDRYSSLAYTLAYRVLGDHGQTEDVVQEAFLSVWRRADTFDTSRGQVRGWLVTIARNAALDRRRGRYLHYERERDIDDYTYHLSGDHEEVWSEVVQRIDQEKVRQAMDDLPPEQRTTLELAYFGGMSQSQIAQETGAPLGTVKSRARLGLRRLAELLQPVTQEDD